MAESVSLNRLRLLLAAQTWVSLARQTAWRLAARPRPPSVLTWPLDPSFLRRTHLEWPARYAWRHAGLWVDPLKDGLRRWVPVKLDRTLEQLSARVVLVRLRAERRSHTVAIDFADSTKLDEQCLSASSLYFKMQHAVAGYESDRVVPGGFVPGNSAIYDYLAKLRSVRDTGPGDGCVYGRFGMRFASDVRRKAIRILTDDARFTYKGGARRAVYSQSLYEAARADVCIDLPGNGDFCHRLIDYFAIGSCVVGPRHGTTLHVPLEDRVHLAYANSDLSDLGDLCVEYLTDESKRRELCRNSREFFDKYLHRDQLASYYLQTMFRRLHDVE